ncbi:MAG TPA: hypothetical protein VKA57_16770 [Solirubrobacteraceae bacterium]|nr:hypothetical protein [Solirubrobacteraceae bacterium]
MGGEEGLTGRPPEATVLAEAPMRWIADPAGTVPATLTAAPLG